MKNQLSIFLVLQMAIQTFASSMLDHEIFQRKLFSGERDLTEAYGTNFFADSQNTYYDPYQMSWRFLGHFVKCGYPSDRYDKQSQHSHDNNNQEEFGNNYCQRYLMWAAVSATNKN